MNQSKFNLFLNEKRLGKVEEKLEKENAKLRISIEEFQKTLKEIQTENVEMRRKENDFHIEIKMIKEISLKQKSELSEIT